MQQRLMDNRVAMLEETEACYRVINSDELRETCPMPWLFSCGKQMCKNRAVFEKKVSASYEIKNMKWVDN